jgi:hypothetical protein
MVSRRKQGSFQQMYAEAHGALVTFHAYAADVLLSCHEGVDFPAIRANFILADEHYKETTKIAAHLSLWHAAKVEGKVLSAWTQREIEQDALVRSLSGMASSCMNHLLSVYRIWLAKDQFVRPLVVDEDNVGAP